MVERLSFEGGTVFADVDEPGGVWALVKELELCGGCRNRRAGVNVRERIQLLD